MAAPARARSCAIGEGCALAGSAVCARIRRALARTVETEEAASGRRGCSRAPVRDARERTRPSRATRRGPALRRLPDGGDGGARVRARRRAGRGRLRRRRDSREHGGRERPPAARLGRLRRERGARRLHDEPLFLRRAGLARRQVSARALRALLRIAPRVQAARRAVARRAAPVRPRAGLRAAGVAEGPPPRVRNGG